MTHVPKQHFWFAPSPRQLVRGVVSCSAIALLLLSNVGTASACAIEGAPGKGLQEYLDNLNRALSELSNKSSSISCQPSGSSGNSFSASAGNAIGEMQADFNRAVNGDNFLTSSKFYLTTVIKSEMPPALKRDHDFLVSQTKIIESTAQSIYQRCAGGGVIKDGTTIGNYSMAGKTYGTALGEILENHHNVLNLFRGVASGGLPPDDMTYQLANGDLGAKVYADYNEKAVTACRKNTKSFKDISEKVTSIGNITENIKKYTGAWKEAMDMLKGSGDMAKDQQIEKDLLMQELSNQGVPSNKANAMLRNLEIFNNEGKHNGLAGSLEEIGSFAQKALWSLGYDKAKDALAKSKNTEEYVRNVQNLIEIKDDIDKQLRLEYQEMRAIMGPENRNMDANVAQLVDLHINVQQANTVTCGGIKTSIKVCQSQVSAMGTCDYGMCSNN